MKGLNWDNPLRIRSAATLTAWVQEIGFLPFFANARRLGWDFDGKWQDGRASNREKSIMEHFMNVESTDDPEFTNAAILSTELKKILTSKAMFWR